MLESVLSLMPEALLEYAINGRLPQPIGNHDRWMAPHNCYKAQGNEHMWVTIVAGNEEEWRALCRAMEQPAMADDPRFANAALRKQNEEQLDRIIETWTAQRDRWEITAKLQAAGVAAFPTLGAKDLVEDPHMKARGFQVELAPSGGGTPHPCRHRLEDVGNSMPRAQGRPGPRRRHRFHSQFAAGLFGRGDRTLTPQRSAGLISVAPVSVVAPAGACPEAARRVPILF